MDIVIIAHFITEFVRDGTSRFVYIAEQLSGHHQVELITSRFDHTKKQQRTTREFDLQTKVTLLEEPSYPKNVCLQRFASHAQFGKQVERYLEMRKTPDVIYCAVPSLDCAYAAAQYAVKHNVRFIIDVQDLWPEAFKMVFNIPLISDAAFFSMKRKADFVYACADTIVAVSETYCNRAKAVNKKDAARIPVFLGNKLALFDEYAKNYAVTRKDDKFVLGYCGTLGHSYDIKCIMDAMILLRQKEYTNIAFWVMGDGPLKGVFEKYATEHDLDVVFYGRVPYDKMCGLLTACNACVNPIVGLSVASVINKHGDYAASGLPVINTQQAMEYRRLIDRYECGINCESSNAQSVADAVIWLIDHEDERRAMGAQARKMAEELFDRNNCYPTIFELFV